MKKAIKQSPNQKLTSDDICEWMKKNVKGVIDASKKDHLKHLVIMNLEKNPQFHRERGYWYYKSSSKSDKSKQDIASSLGSQQYLF